MPNSDGPPAPGGALAGLLDVLQATALPFRCRLKPVFIVAEEVAEDDQGAARGGRGVAGVGWGTAGAGRGGCQSRKEKGQRSLEVGQNCQRWPKVAKKKTKPRLNVAKTSKNGTYFNNSITMTKPPQPVGVAKNQPNETKEPNMQGCTNPLGHLLPEPPKLQPGSGGHGSWPLLGVVLHPLVLQPSLDVGHHALQVALRVTDAHGGRGQWRG